MNVDAISLFATPSIPTPADVEAALGDTLLLSFWVAGEPAPGGSKTYMPIRTKGGALVTEWKQTKRGRMEFPVGRLADAGKGNAKWKSDVAKVGRLSMLSDGLDLLDEPLGMACWFYTLRPKSHFGRRGGEPYIKDSAPQYNATNPDATKLMRSTEDALEGVVYVNDSRLVMSLPIKCYGNRAGARVLIWRMR